MPNAPRGVGAAVLCCLAWVATSAGAATIRVPEDQPDIQSAVDMSTDGDTVDIAPGTYSIAQTIVVNKAITIRARDLYQTILDGNGSIVLVQVQAAAHFSGLRLRNAVKGIQQRSSPNVTWSANNMIVESIDGAAFEVNDVASRIGTAIFSNVVVDDCVHGFNTNDANGIDVRNSIVMNCATAFVGFDHNFFTVSYTTVFGNAQLSAGPVTFGVGVTEADPDVGAVSTARLTLPFFPRCSSPLIDAGDPAPAFRDASSPPSLGTERNDIGAYGGPEAVLDLTEQEKREILAEAGCVLPVTIDIKPGSFPNSINPRARGVVPVAVLSGVTFDAGTVDASTVRFGPTGTEAAPAHSAEEDVNGDGLGDLVLHFRIADTRVTCDTRVAWITGATFSGAAISGSDSVRPVGCGKKRAFGKGTKRRARPGDRA